MTASRPRPPGARLPRGGQYGRVTPSTNSSVPAIQVPTGTPLDLVGPWLEIDAESLLWNLAQVRDQVGDVSVMAVVKCNAYGHGAV